MSKAKSGGKNRSGGSHNSIERAEYHVRLKQAAELRLMGATYQQIGEAIGVTRQEAHQMLGRAMSKTQESIEQVLQIELERLDRMLFSIWPKNNATWTLEAIDRALKIMDRRHKLYGFGQPGSETPLMGGSKLTDLSNLTEEQSKALEDARRRMLVDEINRHDGLKKIAVIVKSNGRNGHDKDDE